jgi:hypothetical protein
VEFYSRRHRGLVETKSPVLGRTTTEPRSREFGHAFVSDGNSGDEGLVGYGAIGKVDCHDHCKIVCEAVVGGRIVTLKSG